MSNNHGSDGWRYAYVIFSSGRRWLSRKYHYFRDGVSLCGAHSDKIVNKFVSTVGWVMPEKKCIKCQRKVLKEAEAEK